MEWSISDINYLAVLVSTVCMMVVGFLWYSPVLFAKPWMELMNFKKEEMEGKGTAAIFGALFMAMLISFLMAVLMEMVTVTNIKAGLEVGIVVSLIVALAIGTNFLFEKKTCKHYFITVGYNVVTILIVSIILSAWQ